MKREYFQFTIEELIGNRDFVTWVLQGKNQKEWEVLLAESPEFQSTVKKARKIVELLRDRHDSLGEDDILAIWKNIESFENKIRNRSRLIKMQRFLRYAAILVVALLISSTGIWMIYQNQKGYVFSTSLETETGTQSRLFLSNGTTVDLKKENSKIALNADQMVVIDNDQMIDLSKDSNPDESKMNEVVIPYGKKSQLVLEDGTKVWLNAGSRMAFPTKFIGKKREVFLEGEAYFEVAHNKDLPFIVNTNDISVKVLGTKFNLSAYKSDQLDETVLLEGKVVVSEKSAFGFMKGETILAPNQKASYDKEHKHISVKNEPNVELAIAWTEGWFNFSRQNLEDVLNKLQRYYNVQFVFDSDFSTADLITGKLDLKDSIEQVMLALGDVANIQFRIKGDKIYIEKKINEIKMIK
ncbi:MAG: FecR domain-containing protein [Bacteroidetes bacterium]|nr:FecR domain-containing protein [Bacteroidota bacterium]